jgi:hypothetical protein
LKLSRLLASVLLSLLFVSTLSAQSLELAIAGGGYFPANNSLSSGNAAVVEGTFSYRLFSVPLAALYFDFPIAGTLDSALLHRIHVLSALSRHLFRSLHRSRT